MLGKPKECRGCPLYTEGLGFARTRGEGLSKVLVVAEALGEDEARAGKPLVGRAGATWDRIVARTTDPTTGLKLSSETAFLHANVVNCRPPDNHLVGAPYEFGAINHCTPYLEETIREFKPAAILTLGNVPLRKFTGHWGIEQLRGYIFETKWGPVIPTYHPSYIQRGKWNLARIVQLDILRALEVAREGSQKFLHDKTYELSPSWHTVSAFVEGWRKAGRPPLAFDIETPFSGEAAENEEMVFEDDPSYTILMVSLSYEPFKAISIPWQEPFISLLREVFSEAPMSLVWNAKFDVPRLLANEVHFGGEIVDVMLAWHWLEPSLPMGLKWVATIFCPDMHAWKLDMGQNFQWYNAADSDVLLRVFRGVRERLEEQGRWKTFLRHFVEFGKILQKMTERGVSLDHDARAAARERFQARFDTTIKAADALAPGDIKPLHPKRGYKKTPKDTEGLVQIEVELTPEEEVQARKRDERLREKRRKEAEKAARKRAREEARAAKQREREERGARPRRSRKKGGAAESVAGSELQEA